MLLGTSAAGIGFAGIAAPWRIARAGALGQTLPVRSSGTVSTELGGTVNGTYQLHASSVTHHTSF
jgi:hypothetical protein